MKTRDEFVDFLLAQMQSLGQVTAKSMFGGYGMYVGDLMFALVADKVLYFKTDADNLPDFEQRGLPPFTYQRNGKPYRMSYYEAPAEVLDDTEALQSWANKAITAALNNRKTGDKAGR